jgi:hypothetical protein
MTNPIPNPNSKLARYLAKIIPSEEAEMVFTRDLISDSNTRPSSNSNPSLDPLQYASGTKVKELSSVADESVELPLKLSLESWQGRIDDVFHAFSLDAALEPHPNEDPLEAALKTPQREMTPAIPARSCSPENSLSGTICVIYP